jgi:purine-binding chemotaxis protein CheW
MYDSLMEEKYVHVYVHHHEFCINVAHVQDVLNTPKVTKIPLSQPHIHGLINLRGRVVTAIDMGIKLGLSGITDTNSQRMSVIVEHENELYSLIFSDVGEVLTLSKQQMEKKTDTIDQKWREFSSGICIYNQKILVVLEINSLIG